MAKRDDCPVELPYVQVAYKLGDLSSHPAYEEAKAGGKAASFIVADSLVTTELVKQIVDSFGRDFTVIPVLAQESAGRNKIPLAVALRIEEETGGIYWWMIP